MFGFFPCTSVFFCHVFDLAKGLGLFEKSFFCLRFMEKSEPCCLSWAWEVPEHFIKSASWPFVKPLTSAGCCLQIKLPRKLANSLSPFFCGFPFLLLFPASFHCIKLSMSMRCLISVHISSVTGNNKSQFIISINKMYCNPSTVNGRKVCLAHACNNDMAGAAIL